MIICDDRGVILSDHATFWKVRIEIVFSAESRAEMEFEAEGGLIDLGFHQLRGRL